MKFLILILIFSGCNVTDETKRIQWDVGDDMVKDMSDMKEDVFKDVSSRTITTFSPSDGEGGVDIFRSVEVTFSEQISKGSLNASNFKVEGDANEVETALVVDPSFKSARLVPKRSFDLSTKYTANLLSGITNTQGNAIEEINWTFTTRDGEWQEASFLELDGGTALSPRIAYDKTGGIVAMWSQGIEPTSSLYINRYHKKEGWGGAKMITPQNLKAEYPQFVVGSKNQIHVIWQVTFDDRSEIWTRLYLDASWSEPKKLTVVANKFSQRPQLVIGPNDSVDAIWVEKAGKKSRVWSARFQPTKGWQQPVRIDSSNQLDPKKPIAILPKIAVNSKGGVMAVWHQSNGVSYDIWTNLRTKDGWGIPQIIENSSNNSVAPEIAFFKNEADVFWTQASGVLLRIATNHFDDDGWHSVKFITEPQKIGGFDFIFNQKGDVTVVWAQSPDGTVGNHRIWMNQRQGKEWGTPEFTKLKGLLPQLALSNTKLKMIFYVLYEGCYEVSKSNNVWSQPENFLPNDSFSLLLSMIDNHTQFTSDPSGRGAFIWLDRKGQIMDAKVVLFE